MEHEVDEHVRYFPCGGYAVYIPNYQTRGGLEHAVLVITMDYNTGHFFKIFK